MTQSTALYRHFDAAGRLRDRVYPYGRGVCDPDNMNPRSTFFAKRVGLRWEVWSEYEGGTADFGGVRERRALWGVRFWRSLNALRVAADMQAAFNEGCATAALDAVTAPVPA